MHLQTSRLATPPIMATDPKMQVTMTNSAPSPVRTLGRARAQQQQILAGNSAPPSFSKPQLGPVPLSSGYLGELNRTNTRINQSPTSTDSSMMLQSSASAGHNMPIIQGQREALAYLDHLQHYKVMQKRQFIKYNNITTW